MAFINKKGKQLVIALSNKESEESGLKEGARYSIVKEKDNTWLLTEYTETGTAEIGKKAPEKKTVEKVPTNSVPKTPVPESPISQSQALPQAKQPGKSGEEPCLEIEGFTICKDTNEAKTLSLKLKERIEKGEIRGIKSFDGMFYIAENDLYQKHKDNALALISKETGINSERVSAVLKIDPILARIVCELLKDEGEIIEKRKEQYQAI